MNSNSKKNKWSYLIFTTLIYVASTVGLLYVIFNIRNIINNYLIPFVKFVKENIENIVITPNNILILLIAFFGIATLVVVYQISDLVSYNFRSKIMRYLFKPYELITPKMNEPFTLKEFKYARCLTFISAFCSNIISITIPCLVIYILFYPF